MRNLKKKIRMLGFILLVLLAVFGISIGGGLPLLPKRKENNDEIKIELVDETSDSLFEEEEKP